MTHLSGSNPIHGGETRRDFIKKTAEAAAFAATANVLRPPASGQNNAIGIALVLDAGDPLVKQRPVQWAAEQMCEALKARGFGTQSFAQLDQAAPDRELILVGGRGSALGRQVLESAGAALPDKPEALGLVRGKVGTRSVLLACGSDVRGLVYSLLELADRATYSEAPLAALGSIERIVVNGRPIPFAGSHVAARG